MISMQYSNMFIHLCNSDNIKDEVINFLRARTDSNILAKQCYMRLVKMITHGRRTYPPHIAEVQAIQVNINVLIRNLLYILAIIWVN